MKKLLLYALLAAGSAAPLALYAAHEEEIQNMDEIQEGYVQVDSKAIPGPFAVELENGMVYVGQEIREGYAALSPTDQPGDLLPIAIARVIKKGIQKSGPNHDEIVALDLGLDLNFASSTLSPSDRRSYSIAGMANLENWKKYRHIIVRDYPDQIANFSRLLDMAITNNRSPLAFRCELLEQLLRHPIFSIVAEQAEMSPQTIKRRLDYLKEELRKAELADGPEDGCVYVT